MSECFKCGARVQPGQGYRREVYVGHSSGSYWSYGSGRYSSSRSRRYAIRTICPTCAHRMDARKNHGLLMTIGAVVFLVIAGAVSHNDSSIRSDASSAAISYPSPAPIHHVRHHHHTGERSTLEIPSRIPERE